MGVSLLSNLGALESQNKLNSTGSTLNKTIQRLSSGLRINSSGDDAAGLAIANKFRSDISILNQGVRNANDGLSTLQIIDGGLNTISNLLDRAASLAAQSASDTFIGSRDTLQAEFGKVLEEISRQAENIGLVDNGTYNRSLTTVIGGGSDSFAAAGTNNGVQIDLSGANNRVDAKSLGISTLNIASTGSVSASGGIDFRNTAATLTAAETLTFKTVAADGTLSKSTSVTLDAGATAAAALAKLQAEPALQEAGISASVNAQTGALEFKGSGAFTVSSSVAAAGQTGISTAAGDIRVSSAANSASLTAIASTGVRSQKLSINVGSSGQTVDVTVSNGANATAAVNADSIATAINNNQALRDAGIYAVRTNTTGTADYKLVSSKTSFSYSVAAATGAGSGDIFGAATVSPVNATPATTGGASGAKQALDSIKAAITSLGKVQGTVGAGQNTLQQAIDLATSQITNYQSAESRIRDADVTSEASNLSRLTVLQQAGVAALAQANQSTQAVLSLLR